MDFTPNFAHAAAAQAANEQTADAMVMMMTVAYGVRVSINMGGRLVRYVYDKAKQVFKEDKPTFEDIVETYQFSANASLLQTPHDTPENETDDKVQVKRNREVGTKDED